MTALFVCVVVMAVLVGAGLFVHDVATSYHQDEMDRQSYDLRMKHIHSLYRMRAFQGEHLMTREEIIVKFDEEIGKV